MPIPQQSASFGPLMSAKKNLRLQWQRFTESIQFKDGDHPTTNGSVRHHSSLAVQAGEFGGILWNMNKS